ncbi:sensor domain-containing diguanylate cyclase [Comamonas guangdongensis]|uniref:diguanylate cyclase n=1 Tax=Comamonas guangdongensis TaxID=510515 RepID=A0ABV4A1H7_9BURK
MTISSRALALNGLLLFLYVVLGRLTFAGSVEHGNVTSVIFVPEGVALAFAIRYGARVAPGILLGQTLLSYWSGPSVLGGLGIGFFNAFEAVLGGYLFHRWRLSLGFDRLRDVGLFACMTFFIMQPISATGGVLILLAHGMIPAHIADLLGGSWWIQGIQKPLLSLDLALPAWMHWWTGNCVGQLLVAPLVLAWLGPAKHKAPPLRWIELLGLAAGTAVVLLLARSDLPSSPVLLLALGYALLVWIALERGLRAVTVANALMTMMVVWLAVRGDGFMSHLPVPERLFYVSFFVGTAVLFSLTLFALFEERKDLIHQLTELPSKDALTQLGNRRHFMEQSERELARARRDCQPVSLALLDVDHFKAINDRHGHTVGDQVLQMFARCCRATLRASDLIGRVGGEEFAVLLPDTDAQNASEVLRRLLNIIAQQSIHTPDGSEVRITFSAGVVEIAPGASLDAMYSAADRALYQGKSAGRNRVEVFRPGRPETSPASGDAQPET